MPSIEREAREKVREYNRSYYRRNRESIRERRKATAKLPQAAKKALHHTRNFRMRSRDKDARIEELEFECLCLKSRITFLEGALDDCKNDGRIRKRN